MPLLNTVGSASIRAYGRGKSEAVPIPTGYFGAEYSGFNNASPIQFGSYSLDSTYNRGTDSSDNIPLMLGNFIDHSRGKFFSSYPGVSTNNMQSSSVNATYSGSAAFYRDDGSGTTYFNSSNGMNADGWNNGRGNTIAYLSDAARTPVWVTGTTGDSNSGGAKILWFASMAGAYLGRLDASAATTTTGNTTLMEGLAWDGFRLLAMFNGDTKVFRYTLPATLSTSSTIPTVALHSTVTTASSVNYGMSWTGDGLMQSTGYGAGRYVRFLPTDTSSTLVTTISGWLPIGSAIDYKNEVFVNGGWYGTALKTFVT